MANVKLQTMQCPTCGASLKAENTTDTIECIYCGNLVIPVKETTVAPVQNPIIRPDANVSYSGTVKVEGIKTSASALAYIEQLFEEYDWEAFAYAQTLSIDETDGLARSLKLSSADDKNTWFVCFKAIFVPYVNKIKGCKQILNSIIEEYKKDNLDAYSKFDAYKRISAIIARKRTDVVANLEKIAANAARYGASEAEYNALTEDINSIKNSDDITVYKNIEDIAEIKSFIAEKNAKIAQELALEGINADSEYATAKALIENKNYVQALNVLTSLKGYLDTKDIISKIDKYFLIDDVLEIEGNLYYFKKASSDYNDSLNLHPTVGGKIAESPIVTNINQMITNYADILYYLGGGNKLKMFNLSTNTETLLYDASFDSEKIYSRERKVFLLVTSGSDYTDTKKPLVELDLTNGKTRIIVENVKKIISCTDNKLVYTITEKETNENGYNTEKTTTCVMNVDTLATLRFRASSVKVVGFVNDCVVYTEDAPNANNKNLYLKALNTNEAKRLIEPNIYRFFDIINDRLFYFVGNERNKTLININPDGTDRKEWPLYISDVLFVQGDWLYFVRRSGYNSILCKSRFDGSKFCVIATDIGRFITLKNGYLYYLNSEATLFKVRMDGSNLQKLCENVEQVLSVKEDKIIFTSIDERISSGFELATVTIVKSIYAVDFSGSGKIKLAYNIKSAKEYDDNTVYYIATEEGETNYDGVKKFIDKMYKLNTETNQTEKLLDLEIQQNESKISGFAIAMIFMGILLFLGIIGFAAEVIGLGVFGLIGALISLLIGVAIKTDKKE